VDNYVDKALLTSRQGRRNAGFNTLPVPEANIYANKINGLASTCLNFHQ
jgi:hypothetical protein